MVNTSKKNDARYWHKWGDSGAVKPYGKAYVPMYLQASKEQIEAKLPKARQAAQTPSNLEISLRKTKELMKDKTSDPKLVRCIDGTWIEPIIPKKYFGPIPFKTNKIRMGDLPYVIEARYSGPGASNEKAAAEVTDVTNYLYYAFGQDRPFYAEVMAKAPDKEYYPWTND